MLTIKAEGSAGCNLRDDMLPSMVDLARRTGCRVEVAANDTKFWVDPDDTVPTVQDAYDRLYMSSRLVASFIQHGIPPPPPPRGREPRPRGDLSQMVGSADHIPHHGTVGHRPA